MVRTIERASESSNMLPKDGGHLSCSKGRSSRKVARQASNSEMRATEIALQLTVSNYVIFKNTNQFPKDDLARVR